MLQLAPVRHCLSKHVCYYYTSSTFGWYNFSLAKVKYSNKYSNKLTFHSVCFYSCSMLHICSFAKTICPVKVTEMSAKKKMDSRKRNASGGVSEVTEKDVEGWGDEKKEIVSSGRATRGRKPTIKIEMEDDTKNDGDETSKYFRKKEGATSAGTIVKQEVKPELDQESLNAGNTEEPGLEQSLSPSKKKKPEPIKVSPHKNWEKMLENIKIMRSTKTAAVDTMGCERTADIKQPLKVQRFQTLVSLMLSSQTKDQVTYAAMERLKEGGLTVQSILDIKEEELAELLKPVGFYRRKATYIKKTAGILRETYDDDIPKTIEDLCALPGVGPKMAYICMNAAWNENAGIGVDTHVHRISNRLKWTGAKGTSTPEKTREALESWLPKELWQEVNILLVGFGQEICLPIGPKCSICLNKDICPSAQIARSSKSKKK